MPQPSRDILARKLHQNWMNKFPETRINGVKDMDDSLTNLNWLQNMNLMKTHNPPLSPPPEPINSNYLTLKRTISCDPTLLAHVRDTAEVPDELERLEYRTNPLAKPNYSYTTLIYMAMRELRRNKITLSDIYEWIMDNFMYYRTADPIWQNSVRHNLSISKCFQKVLRRKDEPGKGGFWRIHPDFQKVLECTAATSLGCPVPTSTFVPMIPIGGKRRHPGEVSSTPRFSLLQAPGAGKRMRPIKVEQTAGLTFNGSYLPGGIQIKTESDYERSGPLIYLSMDMQPDAKVNGPIPLRPYFNPAATLDGMTPYPWFSSPHEADHSQQRYDYPVTSYGFCHHYVQQQSSSPSTSSISTSATTSEHLPSLPPLTPALDNLLTSPLDLTTEGDPLDLTIHGVRLKPPPEWWMQSMSGGQLESCGIQRCGVGANCLNNSFRLDSSLTSIRSGLAPSPLFLEEDQKWVDEQLNLEELDSILGLN